MKKNPCLTIFICLEPGLGLAHNTSTSKSEGMLKFPVIDMNFTVKSFSGGGQGKLYMPKYVFFDALYELSQFHAIIILLAVQTLEQISSGNRQPMTHFTTGVHSVLKSDGNFLLIFHSVASKGNICLHMPRLCSCLNMREIFCSGNCELFEYNNTNMEIKSSERFYAKTRYHISRG